MAEYGEWGNCSLAHEYYPQRQEATFPGGAGLEWIIEGVRDVNGDGIVDLIWRHADNGETAVWLMNSSGLRQGATFPGGAGPEWELRPAPVKIEFQQGGLMETDLSLTLEIEDSPVEAE